MRFVENKWLEKKHKPVEEVIAYKIEDLLSIIIKLFFTDLLVVSLVGRYSMNNVVVVRENCKIKN